MVLVQNWPFFPLFFQALQGRKMCFTIFQNEKTPSQAIKTEGSKCGKIEIFAKGLTHGFGGKLAIFHLLFLGNIGQENVFYDILERKNAFLGYKNKFKSLKIETFAKGLTHGFGPKLAIFPSFFRHFRAGKCVLRYSRTRKRLPRL